MLGADEQDARTTRRCATATRCPRPGCRWSSPTCTASLPAVVAGLRADRPGTRVAYVMTDGGALPLWFSRTVAALDDRLVGTVTVGQAFGGDLEAVTLHSGLLAARLVLGAEVAVVTQGPGNLGTGTRWGFSGVACGEAVNAAAALGGRPVAVLRMSARRTPARGTAGVSHHSLTAYGRVALVPADVVVPSLRPRGRRAAPGARAAPAGRRRRRRAAGGPARVRAAAVDDGARARRRPAGLPRRRRRRSARRRLLRPATWATTPASRVRAGRPAAGR